MDCDGLISKAKGYMQTLCYEIPSRRLGSDGNGQATSFFAETLERMGLTVTDQAFDCLDWKDDGASLVAGEETFHVSSSPYTLECSLNAPLVVADTLEALSRLDSRGHIQLLMGEIAQEQLMPKKFPFYNPEHHQNIYRLLEARAPGAIITATSRSPELAGGMYPFPMIEDGDFDIPSVYMKDVNGKRLAAHEGQTIALKIKSTRIPARGQNVIARINPDMANRIVLCAHIDAKDDTPGALDNGTGVILLLLLAEHLANYNGRFSIELLALNGEDHYSAQGQKEFIQVNEGRMDDIVLAINMDLAGYIEGYSAYSLYGCPDVVSKAVNEVMARYEGMLEGPQWYQGDHSIFIQNDCPAMAITSDHFMELSARVTHTQKDNLDLVDYSKLVDISFALRDLVEALNLL